MLKTTSILTALILLSACGSAPSRIIVPKSSAYSQSGNKDVTVYKSDEKREDPDSGKDMAEKENTPDKEDVIPTDPVVPEAPSISPRAADLELLRSWSKGEFVGNDSFNLSFVEQLEIVEK